MSSDPFVYPGTDVLRNKKGVRDLARLEPFEAQVTAVRIAQLADAPVHGNFDLDHLKALHRHIFQDVYPWAGRLREGTGMMTKVRLGRRVTYGNSDHVAAEGARVLRSMQREDQLRGLAADAFAGRLAFFYSELDAVHPFREGNSRTLRAFTEQLAQHAGHKLDWTAVSRSEEARDALYQARDLAVMAGDTSVLRALLTRALAPKQDAVARVVDAMRPPEPPAPPPWAPPSASLTGRICAFEERMNAEKKPPPKVGETPAPELDDMPRPKQGPKP